MPDQQNERPKSPPQSDDRTPSKTIGEIKYAQQGDTNKEAHRVGDGGDADNKSSQQHSQKEGPAAYAARERAR